MGLKSFVAAAACLAATVMGHGYTVNFTTDGVTNQGFLLDYYYQKVNTGSFPKIAAWYAEDLDSGFVSPSAYQSADIICHRNAAPGALTATVKAGGSFRVQWGPDGHPWPHPFGPILLYVASCGTVDCAQVDKLSLKWVKVDATGIDYATQKWAQQTLIDQAGKWTHTVPSFLAPGNYVFRHELIALHGAASANGAQNYPQCYNVKVTGSGNATLPVGTPGTSLYKSNDPGILLNPYVKITNYVMPGPALWTGQ